VTLGTVAVDPARIKYAGLTPGSGGLYQINLIVPKESESTLRLGSRETLPRAG